MKICIIPARGGSKRIKNKNLKKFLKTPIIGIVIQKLKKMNFFDKIIVSTDDLKIKNLSKKYGADLILHRNKRLSRDDVGSCEIISNSIKQINQMKIFPNFVFCIYPTSVFIKKKHLQKGIKILNENKAIFVFSATKYPHPIQRSFFFRKNKLTKNFQNFGKTQTQKLDVNYFDAGQFYVGKPNNWIKFDNIFQKNSLIVELSQNECKDIDDINDWKFAELLYQNLKKIN